MRGGVAALVGILIGCLVPVMGAPAPAYADGTDCTQVSAGTDSEATTTPSEPATLLRVEAAHREVADRGAAPGEGQTIAVVGSGVLPGLASGTKTFGTTADLEDPSGTTAAGLIVAPPNDENGVIGIAPASQVFDVTVFDSLAPQDEQQALDPSRVSAGLRWLAENARDRGIDIAVLSFQLSTETDELKAAVAAVDEAGVVMVAPAGDRLATAETTAEGDGPAQPEVGLDAKSDVYPAAYPEVIAVTAVDGIEAGTALTSSAIEFALPSANAVSVGSNGERCELLTPSSFTAAASFAGLVALVASAYPDDNDAEVLARIKATSSGGGELADPDRYVGYGQVQPVEAITAPRPPIKRDGSLRLIETDEAIAPAAAPEPEPDLLADVRRNALWWGLLAGGLLVVALVARPLLSRRHVAD